MPNVFGSVRQAERTAAALPTGYRVNLALYAMVVLGVALIVLEVRGSRPTAREVQTLPRLTTETTRPAPAVEPAPTVLGPGDLTPTPPPAVTPGGVVVGQPGPGGPATAPAPGPSEAIADTNAPDAASTAPAPAPPQVVFTGVPAGGRVLIPAPTVSTAERATLLGADPPPPTTGTEGGVPGVVNVAPVSIPPVKVPAPVHVRTP